jgi:hypothetical protein
VSRGVGCRVGAAPCGAGTSLRLTRQGLLQPFTEHDLCVARLGGVQARGARVVRVGEVDVGARGGGDDVPVAEEPACGAGVDAVGEGFGDLLTAEARTDAREQRGAEDCCRLRLHVWSDVGIY